jgi:glycosyltransferase involved in cell wall biosynthesis
MPHLSIIIPVLNESSLIPELIKRVKFNAQIVTEDFEVILIDDGSEDKTWNEIKCYGSLDHRIKGLKFSRNFGHHYAITSGLNFSKGEWAIVMDGDLQDRPEVIPELYKKAQEGYEVVFVSRVNRPEKFYYKLAQKIFYWLLNLFSGLEFNSKQANFSIIKRNVVEAFNQFPENSRFYVSTIKWLGFETAAIEADHGERFSGKPSYTLRKRFKLAIDIILAFSNKPLRVIIYLGIFLSIFSIFLVINFVTENRKVLNLVNTKEFSTIIVSTMGGVILMVLGVIGIYVGNIYTQVKQRPLYVVSEKMNFPN